MERIIRRVLTLSDTNLYMFPCIASELEKFVCYVQIHGSNPYMSVHTICCCVGMLRVWYI